MKTTADLSYTDGPVRDHECDQESSENQECGCGLYHVTCSTCQERQELCETDF